MLPEDKLDWAPVAEVWTARELIQHLSDRTGVAALVGESWEAAFRSPEPVEGCTTGICPHLTSPV